LLSLRLQTKTLDQIPPNFSGARLLLSSDLSQIVAEKPPKRIDSRVHNKSTDNKSEELPALPLGSSSFIFPESKKMRYLGKRCEKLGGRFSPVKRQNAPIPFWNFPF
jgi:hypothetical protein